MSTPTTPAGGTSDAGQVRRPDLPAPLNWLTNSTLTERADITQGTEQWHDQRRGIVTASVVGQLVSVGYMGAEAFHCPDCDAEPNHPCTSKVKRAGTYGTIKTFHTARSDIAESSRNDEHLVIRPAHNDTSRGATTLLASERITGWTEPNYISDDMWRGIQDEPVARDLYTEHFALRKQPGQPHQSKRTTLNPAIP